NSYPSNNDSLRLSQVRYGHHKRRIIQRALGQRQSGSGTCFISFTSLARNLVSTQIYPVKSLRLAGVMMTERTWPLFPSGFTGMSLIFKVRPAALPIDRCREFSAVNLRVMPGSRTSPGFAELPSAATLIHVFSSAWMSNVITCVFTDDEDG